MMKGRQHWGGSQKASFPPFLPPESFILSQEKPAAPLSFLTPHFLPFKTILFRCWKPFFSLRSVPLDYPQITQQTSPGMRQSFSEGKQEAEDLFWERRNHTSNRLLLANPSQNCSYKLQPLNLNNFLIKGRATDQTLSATFSSPF